MIKAKKSSFLVLLLCFMIFLQGCPIALILGIIGPLVQLIGQLIGGDTGQKLAQAGAATSAVAGAVYPMDQESQDFAKKYNENAQNAPPMPAFMQNNPLGGFPGGSTPFAMPGGTPNLGGIAGNIPMPAVPPDVRTWLQNSIPGSSQAPPPGLSLPNLGAPKGSPSGTDQSSTASPKGTDDQGGATTEAASSLSSQEANATDQPKSDAAPDGSSPSLSSDLTPKTPAPTDVSAPDQSLVEAVAYLTILANRYVTDDPYLAGRDTTAKYGGSSGTDPTANNGGGSILSGNISEQRLDTEVRTAGQVLLGGRPLTDAEARAASAEVTQLGLDMKDLPWDAPAGSPSKNDLLQNMMKPCVLSWRAVHMAFGREPGPSDVRQACQDLFVTWLKAPKECDDTTVQQSVAAAPPPNDFTNLAIDAAANAAQAVEYALIDTCGMGGDTHNCDFRDSYYQAEAFTVLPQQVEDELNKMPQFQALDPNTKKQVVTLSLSEAQQPMHDLLDELAAVSHDSGQGQPYRSPDAQPSVRQPPPPPPRVSQPNSQEPPPPPQGWTPATNPDYPDQPTYQDASGHLKVWNRLTRRWVDAPRKVVPVGRN